MKINYLIGDATTPTGDGKKIIAHIVNDIGYFGKGFALVIKNKWPEVCEIYKNMSKLERKLGKVQYIPVENNIIVANMFAQHLVGYDENGKPPIRYEALVECLKKLNLFAKENHMTIHMPMIGTGLAKGDWKTIEKIIEDNVIDVEVYVYKLK